MGLMTMSNRGKNWLGQADGDLEHVDLFPFTLDEIKRMDYYPSIYRTAVESGIEVRFK